MNNQITGKHYDMNLLLEKWLPVAIPDFSQSYEVSNFGRVRSIDREIIRNGHNMNLTGKVLRQADNGNGYLSVMLSNGKLQRRFLVHRLVANSFLGLESTRPHVNHINGKKNDNRASNLEWCTRQENGNHASITGLVAFGKRNSQYKGSIKAINVSSGEAILLNGTRELKEYGLNSDLVYKCLSGKRKTHKGYRFERLNMDGVNHVNNNA
ncbi:NUMOD4 motif-containing HNH endonuclease [Proteus mirabilis]|nr:NUMOD4 domain-containing protein [Proteus mirabilis]NBM29074.1 hypothetical protein [Proteus sp. G4417]UHD48561.1 NUMOD4 motif-containing HNH endonuclease [Proteus mirabilis]